jgi:hypothetical protein
MRQGVSMAPEKNVPKRIVHMLRASSVLHESLAKSQRKAASLLEQYLEDRL